NWFDNLGVKFAMNDVSPLYFFLGVEVKYFDGDIHLRQSKYDAELVDKTEMTFTKNDSRSLQYLTLTRSDITRSVNLTSQFMQKSNNGHLQGVRRILRYIKGTLHVGLRLISQSPCWLYGYSDSDYGGYTTTRRSTTGYNIYQEMTWITYLLHDLGMFLRFIPTLYCDNMSALYMIINPVMQARTKHVEMEYHFICEKVARGQLVTKFIRSKDQLADIHTIALTKQVFAEFRRKIGVTVPPLTSLRGSDEGS
uniref:Reverse transcriptase Ty1/copia-type domain-containing protein n=1 Tax=Solanum lycopersicum TaxID=4081 RepID=A0A3Q7J5N5_SOLLC